MHEEPRDMLRDLEIAPGLVPAERVFATLAETIKASGLKHGASEKEVIAATGKFSKKRLAAGLAALAASEDKTHESENED